MIVLPGEVLASEESALEGILSDVALCHELGIRTVLAVGCAAQVDAALAQRGLAAPIVGGLRVTDAATMSLVVEAAGKVQLTVAATLSKGPPVPLLRKHGEARRGSAGARCAIGTFVAAKRAGVLSGVDYCETGEVRHVDVDAVQSRLRDGDIVLLSNLGASAAGELLNCQIWQVAAHAAAQLGADKLICYARSAGDLVVDEGGCGGEIHRWLPLGEAESVLAAATRRAAQGDDALPRDPLPRSARPGKNGKNAKPGKKADADASAPSHFETLGFFSPATLLPHTPLPLPHLPPTASARRWPLELACAVAACRSGVPRCHVLDPRVGGALLLELFTPDGVGTMVSVDQYEGTRPAVAEDAPRIAKLLAPLEADGTLVRRSKAALARECASGRFTVVERDGLIVASAALVPFPESGSAELAAFCVDEAYRGSGRGDALLQYVERCAVASGVDRIFLLTTRAADWFQARGFRPAGRAAGSGELPAGRAVDAGRNSLLFVKRLE